MKINELRANIQFDEIIARILSKNGPKPATINGQKQYTWELLLRDESGTVILTLIGAHTGEAYRLNSIVKIVKGDCKAFRDQYQLSLGANGSIQIMPEDPNIPRTIG